MFQEAGHQGLNLAYLDGYTHYHGTGDTPDRVDPAGDAPWKWWIRHVPARGAELELGAGPATVRVIDRTHGLPGPAADGPDGTRPPALGVASLGEASLAATTRALE